ncbi:extracellular solute-binding protein [Butyrivibrio sp. WCE2006]|uniref:extracellular solute-binding protein n=1 Tax=Butyrivibrio sp. WCE2006 TaxID=1410611 RepID=UPI000A80C105|nr:extracellular solute-binding protein [Butyrivibrio sp. WCE2006]
MRMAKYTPRIRILGVSMAMILTLFSTGCASSSGVVVPRTPKEKPAAQSISLKLWIPEGEIPMVDQLVRNFDAVHEEYEISYTIEAKGIDEASEEVGQEGVTAADIFYLPSGGVESMAQKGLLTPIEYDFDKLKVDLPESSVSAVTTDGKVYAVPTSPNSFFMFYNKNFFNESEIQSLDTMMSKNLGDGVYNFSSSITNSWYLEMFFLGNGCSLFGEDGKDPAICTFNDEKGLEAGRYILQLVQNPKYLEDIENAGFDAFAEGKVGAYTTGAWNAPDLKAALGDKLGSAALPTAKMGSDPGQLSNFVDFKTVAVSAETKYPEAAEKLAVYLANKDSSARRFAASGDIPVLQNLADNEDISNDLAATALNSQAVFATNQPSIPQMGNYWGSMQAFGEAAYNGEIDDSNLQAKLDELVAGILAPIETEEAAEEEVSEEVAEEDAGEEVAEEIAEEDAGEEAAEEIVEEDAGEEAAEEIAEEDAAGEEAAEGSSEETADEAADEIKEESSDEASAENESNEKENTQDVPDNESDTDKSSEESVDDSAHGDSENVIETIEGKG